MVALSFWTVPLIYAQECAYSRYQIKEAADNLMNSAKNLIDAPMNGGARVQLRFALDEVNKIEYSHGCEATKNIFAQPKSMAISAQQYSDARVKSHQEIFDIARELIDSAQKR